MFSMQENYKKYTITLLFVIIGAMIATGAALTAKKDAVPAQAVPEQTNLAYYSPKADTSQETGKTQAEGNKDQSSGYYVTSYRGRIAVFPAGERVPVLTTDVDVYLLPEADQRLLIQGIPAETLAQARAILEDYE